MIYNNKYNTHNLYIHDKIVRSANTLYDKYQCRIYVTVFIYTMTELWAYLHIS